MLLRNIARTSGRTSVRFKTDQGIIDQPLDIPSGPSDMSMKTRVSFLSQDMADDDRTGIRGLSSKGFRMYDGSFLYGPIAVFPNVCLSWRVAKPKDITPESLKLFFMLQPKLDILVLGVGSPKNMDLVRKNVLDCIRKEKIGLELLPTEDAIPTFNWLNSEYRSVAGCFYPTEDLKVSRGQAAKSMAMLHGNYDTVMDPPHRYLTQYRDPVDVALQRMYGDTLEAKKARQIINEIQQSDLSMKLEKKKQERLQLGAGIASGRFPKIEESDPTYDHTKDLEDQMNRQRGKLPDSKKLLK